MIPPVSLYQLVLEHSKNRPQAPAILSPEKTSLSYRELSLHLINTVLQINRLGFRPGDRLAVVLPNGPEMACAFLAISSVCTCAPLNPSYTLEEFKFYLKDLRVNALITVPGGDQPVRMAAVEMGIPIIDLNPNPSIAGDFILTSDLPIESHIYKPILAGSEDVALVLHTSGTISHPKIVPLTHQNISISVFDYAKVYSLKPSDRCLNVMPLFHVTGLLVAVAASIISGSSIICTTGFLPDRVLGWLSDLGPTWYTAVPTIHQAILEQARHQPEVVRRVHLRFIRSASSPLPPQVAQELETVFKTPVVEAYGLTEAVYVTTNPLPPQRHKFGSAGLVNGTTQVSIRDEKGNILPVNSVGEICIQGRNVITGYENNPAANATAFFTGWLRTGDLGYLDNQGYLFIQGRIKEIINRGGEKISPREIDEVLLQHPAVKFAVAFAVPHPSLGEDIAAAVVLQKGIKVSMQVLRQFTASRLADFKVPRMIIFLEEIPKSATGKVQRIGLAEKLKEQLDAVKIQETAGGSEANTPVEATILSIWQQVLDKQTIGTKDDFLVLGGDSLMAARILLLVNEHFGVNLSLNDIFYAPTITSMAQLVEQRQGNTK